MSSNKRIYSYYTLAISILVTIYGILIWHRSMGPPATYCFWYTTTQVACPACGGSHAIHDIAHGHIVSAFSYNALISLFYLISICCMIWIPTDLILNKYTFEKIAQRYIAALKHKKYSYLLAFFILCMWILNILRYWK